jgi:protein-disulfide isomerase
MQSPLPATMHPQAQMSAEVSLCAAKQSAEAFWEMHDRLFAGVSDWSGKDNAVDVFKGYAAELGLDAAAFASCLDSGETAVQVQAQQQEGQARGISSVPAFYVNDWFLSGAQAYSVFQSTIEKALGGQHPPPTPTPLPEGVSWTDPNPEHPGYTYGSDAYLGSETAPVLMFEFADLGSADNRKFVLETWPELQKKYVDSGKVRLMIKHLGAADQPATEQAAEAAECAGQQKAFWAMFDLLFQRQDEWTKAADVAAALKGYATQLKLDAAAIATCLDQGQTKSKVQEDMDIGSQNQFPPAPVIFVFKGQEGGYVATDQLAQTLEQFAAPQATPTP